MTQSYYEKRISCESPMVYRVVPKSDCTRRQLIKLGFCNVKTNAYQITELLSWDDF